MRIFKKLFVLLLFLPCLYYGATTTLTHIQIKSFSDHWDVLLDLNANPTYKIFPMSKPDRIIVDMANTRLMAKVSRLALGDSPIHDIRAGQQAYGTLRVVFDLLQRMPYQASIAEGNYDNYILTIRLQRTAATKIKTPTAVVATKFSRVTIRS